MDAVIGKNEVGKPTIFTIVDRIDRKILWNTKEFPVEAKDITWLEDHGLFWDITVQ